MGAWALTRHNKCWLQSTSTVCDPNHANEPSCTGTSPFTQDLTQLYMCSCDACESQLQSSAYLGQACHVGGHIHVSTSQWCRHQAVHTQVTQLHLAQHNTYMHSCTHANAQHNTYMDDGVQNLIYMPWKAHDAM